MRRLREKKPYYDSLLANSVSASRLASPVKTSANVSRSAAVSPVNILRFGCPSDIIVHIPLDVARLKPEAQRNLSKVQCTLQDLLEKNQPPPKRTELQDKEKVIEELNSISIPMQSFKEVTPNRRVFSLAIEGEKSSDELRGAIMKRLEGGRAPTHKIPVETTPFDYDPAVDAAKTEAALAPFRLNEVRPYRNKSSFAFFTAVKQQNYKTVRALLSECKQLVHEQDSLGLTALHWAVKREDVLMAETLLSRGANPNAEDMLKRTPLFLAVKDNSSRLVSLLMAQGADPSISAVSGVAPEQIPKEGSPLWAAICRREHPSP